MYGIGNARNLTETLEKIAKQGESGLAMLKAHVNDPNYERLHRTYKTNEMLTLTNLPRSTYKKYVLDGKIMLSSCDSPQALSEKKEFSLEEVDSIRSQTGRGFWHSESPPHKRSAITLAMAMFKGGVGKTTQSTHLAARAAILGLKVLFVDCDYQGSGTIAFGLIPGFDVSESHNLYSSVLNDPEDIKKIIIPSHVHGLDIIPASLSLSAANIELLNPEINNTDKLGSPLYRLQNTLNLIRDKYDLIVLDCPPNFEAFSMNALVASDAFVLPIMPSMLALASAVSFCSTVSELFATISENGLGETINNQLFKVLLTNDPQNQESERVIAIIKQLFGNFLMSHAMPKTIALDRAANDLSILYDLKRNDIRGDKKSFDRALNSMDLVNDEILIALKSIWIENNKSTSEHSNARELALT